MRVMRTPAKTGFTLVELVIVVAIIALLASIAIPNFMEAQFRAKRAEVAPNVTGIMNAQVAYDAAHDQYLVVEWAPSAIPSGKVAVDWPTDHPGFTELGWSPDGKVRGVYAVTTVNDRASQKDADFVVTGRCDVDGALAEAWYTATRHLRTVYLNENDTF